MRALHIPRRTVDTPGTAMRTRVGTPTRIARHDTDTEVSLDQVTTTPAGSLLETLPVLCVVRRYVSVRDVEQCTAACLDVGNQVVVPCRDTGNRTA